MEHNHNLINGQFFDRLAALSLAMKSGLSGYFGGTHLVKTYGQTVEFADFREYRAGDDIRRIDWNLFGRFEKHFIRLFTDERQMQVQIFLDCSASMGAGDSAKGEYAAAMAAALGFLAVNNMDRAQLYFMRGDRAQNPFGTLVGKNAFFNAVKSLRDVVFDGETDIEKCIVGCSDTEKSNGLSVIISDFLTDSDWKKAVDFLCYKRRQVLLVQVLSPEEEDPTLDGRLNMVDAESPHLDDDRNIRVAVTRGRLKAYRRALDEFKQDIRSFCTKRGADYVCVSSGGDIERELFLALPKTGAVV